MLNEEKIVAATAHNVIILQNDYNGPAVVVAEKPSNLTDEQALAHAQTIYANAEAAQERHYDRYSRGDYDILAFMERELKKAGFTILHSYHIEY